MSARRAGAMLYRVVAAGAAMWLAGAILQGVLRYGVDVPFWDQWTLLGTFRRVATGELSWPRALFLSHGEHQIGVDLLFSVASWKLTGMYMPAVMVLNWAIACAFCLLAMGVTRRALPAGSAIPWTVLWASAFFVFNPAAYQVWLWGLPLVYMLVPLLFLCGVAAAQSRLPDGWKIAVAGVCAWLACFTLASGLLLWALLPVVLACSTDPGVFRRERAATGLCVLLLASNLYMLGTGVLAHPGAGAGQAKGLPAMARFFFAYTGNLVSVATEATPVAWAELAGAGLIAFFVLAVPLAAWRIKGRQEAGALAIWTAMGVYSLGAGGMATLGRYHFGVAYAVESSRYVLASAFLPVACVAVGSLLVAALARQLPARLHLYSWALCGTVALVAAGGAFRFLQTGRAWALMEHTHYWDLTGKVAVAAVNLVEMPEYRNIYSTDNREDFQLSANFLNVRGWIRPRLWDEGFVRELAAPERRAEPGFGRVAALRVEGGKLRLAGTAVLADRGERAHAVIVLGRDPAGAKILAVWFPAAAGAWSGEIPQPAPGTAVRCLAYDALSGRAYALDGWREL